jgi:hypothetical protein
VETHCSTPDVDLDELNDLAMDVFYADLLPADMPLVDFEDADGNLPRGTEEAAA